MATLPIAPPFPSPFGRVTSIGATANMNVVTSASPDGYTTQAYSTIDPTNLVLMGKNAIASLIAMGYPDPSTI